MYNIEFPEKNLAIITFSIDKAEFDADLAAAKKATGDDDINKAREFAIATEAGKVLSQAVQEHNLKLATEPSLVSDVTPEGNVNVTMNVVLVPAVELPDYTGLNFEKEPITVTDEEVMQEVLRRISSTRLWKDLPADAEAKEGDQVIIDFVGEKDGVPFQGGTAQNFPLVLGSGQFIPGFEDQLLGAKVGDERTVDVSFPENYFEPSLAGAPVIFKVKINKIEEAVNPELTDEFIEQMKLDGVKTVDELRDKSREDLFALRTQEFENRLAYDILNRIAQGAKMDIPQAMIDSQVAQHLTQYENQVRQYGMSLDDFLKASGQTLEEFKAKVYPEAEQELRAALVLEAIAAKEEIKADDEDLKKEYELLSTVYNFPADQLKMILPEQAVAAQIAQRKTLDFLKEKNTKK
ncbi:trigger factor [Erysipelotrichaceae bacterium RD49]|nr:trigger factor [Erysipelotrichaceae bacterium RD49]